MPAQDTVKVEAIRHEKLWRLKPDFGGLVKESNFKYT